MGSGMYSTTASVDRSTGRTEYSRVDVGRTAFFKNASISDTFKQKNINNAMDPHGVQLRESRDSEDHPNSLGIIIALDVTGSMGSIPHSLVRQGLPNIMGSIIQGGLPDPQVLFVGIGDHEYDRSPLQVGQFESSDELLDKWLTDVYLEGGGGGNDGESYLLAWYFAAMHTQLDCLEKRNDKGFLFTIGDEPVLDHLPSEALKSIMGPGQYKDYSAAELFEAAREKYHVYHIHVKETGSGSRVAVIDGWKQLVSDNLIVVDRHTEIPEKIAEKILGIQGSALPQTSSDELTEPEEIIL